MQQSHAPISQDLVLVGGGHAHVTVLKKWGMRPLPGARVTLISRDLQAPYSGMLPGCVAGHYAFEEAHIDLRPLCRFAGARFFHDEVVGMDAANKRLLCRNRPPVAYDALSINIGAAPAMAGVPGAVGKVTPVKPIDGFWEHWLRLRERVWGREGGTEVRLGIVGAGAGGVELALALQYGLANPPPGRAAPRLALRLFTDGPDVLVAHNPLARAKFRRLLAERGIKVHLEHKVVEVHPGGLRCANGRAFELDEILWATGAGAQTWPAEAGLAVDEQGFIKARETLESVSHPGVFAVGDSAAVVEHPRPKSGVFAVRQGPPLWSNLRRKLLGRPLKPFRPQRAFLSLIATGDKRAVASRSWWALEGAWVWAWKDWIDRRFVSRFNRLPPMPAIPEAAPEGVSPLPPEADLPPEAGMPPEAEAPAARDSAPAPPQAPAMRCGGCGAKVGVAALEQALAGLDPAARADVLLGLRERDDAAAVAVPAGKIMLHSVDFFPAFMDDPYLFGQVAANHALGDLRAMGAEPQTALSIAVVPYGSEKQMAETLAQTLQGALKALNAAGAALVGGHSSEGETLSLGFAVNGLADRERLLRKGGLRPGDRLALTQPLGVGALFAADMRCQAKGPWIAAALASMTQSQGPAAACLLAHGATACTDVTGFGLLGHLLEMIEASRAPGPPGEGPAGVHIELDLAAMPVLDGAEELAARGVVSSLHPRNLHFRRYLQDLAAASKDPRYPLLFDPQTAGGLLAAIPAAQAPACVQALRQRGYAQAALIGRAVPGEAGRPSVALR